MTEIVPRTRRRRRREAFVPDTTVPSPCRQLCMIDKKTTLCTGCKRSVDEIRDWILLSAEEKRAVWAALESR